MQKVESRHYCASQLRSNGARCRLPHCCETAVPRSYLVDISAHCSRWRLSDAAV